MYFLIWVLATLNLIRSGLVEYNVRPSPENLNPTASPGNTVFDKPNRVYGFLEMLFLTTFQEHLGFICKVAKRDLVVIGTVGKYTTHFNVYLLHHDRNTSRSRTVYDPLATKRGEFRWIYQRAENYQYEWYPVELDNARLQYDRSRPLMSFELQHSPQVHDYFETHRVGFY